MTYGVILGAAFMIALASFDDLARLAIMCGLFAAAVLIEKKL